jgi:hypothetical protein
MLQLIEVVVAHCSAVGVELEVGMVAAVTAVDCVVKAHSRFAF